MIPERQAVRSQARGVQHDCTSKFPPSRPSGSGGGDIELSVDGLGSVLRLETPRRAEVLGALAALLLELPLALTIKAEGHARALVATPVAD